MKRLHEKVSLTKEQIDEIGLNTLLAYAKQDVCVSLKSKTLQELLVFSSIHSLLQRKEELENKLKSVKYNLNIRGEDVHENTEYLDLESRLSEVKLFLDKLELNSLQPEQVV